MRRESAPQKLLWGAYFLLLVFLLFHAALDVAQSEQAQPGGGAEQQRAERVSFFLFHDITS